MFDVSPLQHDRGALAYLSASLAFVGMGKSGRPIAGLRTFMTSPEYVFRAVSPPTIPVQSESITTQTNGKLS